MFCIVVFQWESVPYFNNKIICDLVEAKFKGIISVLVCRYCRLDWLTDRLAVRLKCRQTATIAVDWFCAHVLSPFR